MNTETQKSKETVFLSGTDRVQDILDTLYTELIKFGFKPQWFRKPDFPHLHNNAMDNCLEVAKRCDRMILVVDERAGLPYNNTNMTISEAEFEEAVKRKIPLLVFVRNKVWYQCSVYHKQRKNGKIDTPTMDTNEFNKWGYSGDQRVYEFIENIQHTTHDGQPMVPWIHPFGFASEITNAIQEKWMLSEQRQMSSLVAVKEAIISELPRSQEKENLLTTTHSEMPHKVVFTDRATKSINKLTKEERIQVARSLLFLETKIEGDTIFSVPMKRVAGTKDINQIRVGGTGLRLFLKDEGDDGVLVLDITTKQLNILRKENVFAL